MTTQIVKISTIGDSLTEGGVRGAIISDSKTVIPMCYQSWTYNWLKAKGLSVEIRNYGIGGQIVNEICGRFEITVSLPTDYIVTMGGTNDLWRFSDTAPNIEVEIAEDIIEKYHMAIPKAIKLQQDKGLPAPTVVVCSVPPFGNVKNLPKNVQTAVKYVNSELEKMVIVWKNPSIIFCDMHKAMRNDKFFMRDGLAILDGVHFTLEGNQTCGEAIAQVIYAHYLTIHPKK